MVYSSCSFGKVISSEAILEIWEVIIKISYIYIFKIEIRNRKTYLPEVSVSYTMDQVGKTTHFRQIYISAETPNFVILLEIFQYVP